MNRLGHRSRRELVGVHPDMIIVVTTAIVTLPKGLDAAIYDGLRTKVEQEELLARGFSKTLRSKHLPQRDGYGHAVDVVPLINGRLMWDNDDPKIQKLVTQAFVDIDTAMMKASQLHHIPIESGFQLWGWDRPHFHLGKVYR